MFAEIIAGYLKDQLPKSVIMLLEIIILESCLIVYVNNTLNIPSLRKCLVKAKSPCLVWGICGRHVLMRAFELAGVKVLEKLKIRKLKVPDSDLVLICEPDFVVDFEGKKIIVELKSVAALKSEPMPEHIFQVTAYIAVAKADSAVIVYINKSTGEVREFPVAFEEDKLALLFERAKRLHRFVSGKELPPAAGAGQEWQCKGCDFQTECETFGADSAGCCCGRML